MTSTFHRSTTSTLLDDPQAWGMVLQWAEDKIAFPQLVESMARFGDRYDPAEWQDLYNRIFLFSDPGEDIEDADRVRMAIAAVKAEMASRGVAQYGLSAAQSSVANSKSKGKRKAIDSPQHFRAKKKTRHTSVNRFLDIEAHVDGEDELSLSEDEADAERFIVADDANLDSVPQHAPPPKRVYPLSQRAGPSTYSATVDKITRRFMPSSLDDLDDAEYDRLHDEFYGIARDEDQEEEQSLEEEFDDSPLKVLDGPGVWGAIQEWLYGTLNYPTLLELIDFQYDHNPKIQYWEEFLSRLTFIRDLDQRESLFRSIPLSDHLAHCAEYQPKAEVPTNLSPIPTPPVVEATDYTETWAVNIAPRSSMDYIVNAWENASIRSTTHKLLPGRVTVHAPYPNVFLHALPPSHRSCIRGWSLIPVEDQIWPPSSREPAPTVPGWYSVSKRGIYKGDVGYAILFDRDSAELHVLVVPRRLKRRNHPRHAVGNDRNTRTLFSPDIHRGHRCPSYHGLPRYEHSGDVFISGLLLMKLKINQFKLISAPSPSQISLHVVSTVDPPFIEAAHKKYNQLYWKPDDRVKISDSTLGDKSGRLVSIDIENQCAIVCLLDDPEEYELPLSSLSRHNRLGDVVRVIIDPFSDSEYVHHPNLGRSGIICDVDPLLDDITIMDTLRNQFQVPGFLLESHISDQPIYAPFSVLAQPTPDNCNETVQVGDLVDLVDGSHRYNRGYVTQVRQLEGTLTFVSEERDSAGQQLEVPISAVHITPDHRALRFTADRGYNVRSGDVVIVVRGDYMGKTGTVTNVSLEEKSLVISCHPDSRVSITVPINQCARANGQDEDNFHREKEVLIISGPNKGWRGTLVSGGPDTCVVARGGRTLETYKKDHVVVRGLASTLAGRLLTPLQVLQISNVFARAVISGTSERAKTPDPEPQTDPTGDSNPWMIDESDREDFARNHRKLTLHDFMLHPNVSKSLETVRAVFQISPGWRDTYSGRLAKTEVPTPFQTTSGPVPPGHLAVRLTSRTKGAQLLQEIIPETSLEVYRPVKKHTLCMVIKGVHGGEATGSLLSVLKVSTKEKRVDVRRLDNTPASEGSLPFDRVIVVETP